MALMKNVLANLALVATVVSATASSNETNLAVFHANFDQSDSTLQITIPNQIVQPALHQYFPNLAGKELTDGEIKQYLALYIRNTVKLQYGAYPMALGEEGMVLDDKFINIIMKIGKIPRNAHELSVEINSFEFLPEQNNVFKLSQFGDAKQELTLYAKNHFSASLPL
jgi:hypothetical protein